VGASDGRLCHLTRRGEQKPPGLMAGGLLMVEAAGQLFCLFRDRLDYAFTPAVLPGAGRLIRALTPVLYRNWQRG
jgi:hypothetical protein